MSYQSEAAFDKALIEKLVAGSYELLTIADTEELEKNFKKQLERHNKTTFTGDADLFDLHENEKKNG